MMRRTLLAIRSQLPFDAVFVINLDRRTDRMRFMEQQLARADMPLTADRVGRFSAVDGKELDADALMRRGFITALAQRRLRRREQERVWGMDLTFGALGCALSHVKLWSVIAARQLSKVLILEDDCLIQPSFLHDFNDAWRRIEENPAVQRRWELAYVSGLDTENQGHLLEVSPGLRLVPRMHRTTNGYVINARGARALLGLCVPLTFQLDTEMTTMLSSEVGPGLHAVTAAACFTLHPPLIVQATRFGSDIQKIDRDTRDEEISRCAAAGWSDVPP